ncbi:MAG: type 4b pilus protein PilO2 [Cupriavidus necator]
MVAIVGLLRGNVIVDAIAQRGDANRLIDIYRQRCLQANAEYRQIGSAGEGVREPFDWPDFMQPAPRRFGQLKHAPAVKVVPLKPGNKLAWLGAGAAVVVAGGALHYVIAQQEQEARRLQEIRDREQEDPAYQYRQSAQRLLTTPTLRANTAIREVREAIKDIPVLLAGWKLDAITCGIGGCRVTWTRNGGTYAEFDASARAEWKPLTLAEDLNTIGHSLPLKLVGTRLPSQTDWPTKTDFLRTEASRWQRLTDKSIGLEITLSAETVMGVPPGKDERHFANLPGLIYGAKWGVNQSPWWTSELLDSAPDNMTLESIKVNFDGKAMKYTSNGIVYVQR